MSSSASYPGDGIPFHPQNLCCRTPRPCLLVCRTRISLVRPGHYPPPCYVGTWGMAYVSVHLASNWVLWNRYCYWVPCVRDCECHIHQHRLLPLEKGSKARNLGCACPQKSYPQLPGENALPTQLESLRRLINNFSLLALAWKWEEMVYSCEELGQP